MEKDVRTRAILAFRKVYDITAYYIREDMIKAIQSVRSEDDKETIRFLNWVHMNDPYDSIKKLAYVETTDEAASSPVKPGGIDLNSALLDLQIKRDDSGVPLPVFDQPMKQLMNIQGFLPVIINVTPINVPLLLGLLDLPDADSDFGFIPDRDPGDRKARFEYDNFEEVSMLN